MRGWEFACGPRCFFINVNESDSHYNLEPCFLPANESDLHYHCSLPQFFRHPMTPTTIRRWAWIHKWSSLVCTIFMLLLCLTGLPLIYHHEIDGLLGNGVHAPRMAPGTAKANLDTVIAAGMDKYPGKQMMYISQELDEQ